LVIDAKQRKADFTGKNFERYSRGGKESAVEVVTGTEKKGAAVRAGGEKVKSSMMTDKILRRTNIT